MDEAGAARRAGALGANFLPDLSARNNRQNTAQNITAITQGFPKHLLIAELENAFIFTSLEGKEMQAKSSRCRQFVSTLGESGHGHVGGALTPGRKSSWLP